MLRMSPYGGRGLRGLMMRRPPMPAQQLFRQQMQQPFNPIANQGPSVDVTPEMQAEYETLKKQVDDHTALSRSPAGASIGMLNPGITDRFAQLKRQMGIQDPQPDYSGFNNRSNPRLLRQAMPQSQQRVMQDMPMPRPMGGPGSAPGGAGFARPLSPPPSLGGGPAGGGGGGPALGQQEWRLKIEPVERKAGGMIPGYQEGGDLERTQAVLARRRAAAEREIASRQPIEIEGLDVVVPRTMEVVRRREHPGGMPSREMTSVNTSPQMEPFTQKAANQLTEREIQELYIEPSRRRQQRELIDAMGEITERDMPEDAPSLMDVAEVLSSSRPRVPEIEGRSLPAMLRMARDADRRIGRPSADLPEIGMPFEDFGIEDFMVEPGDFQKPLDPSGMFRPHMIEGVDVEVEQQPLIMTAMGLRRQSGDVGDFANFRDNLDFSDIVKSDDRRRAEYFLQHGHFPLFLDDPGAERMLREQLASRRGITGLAGGGMIPMYAQGGEIEGYFLGGLMKGIKSLGKGLGKVAGAAAPFASMIPGVGTLAGAGLAGLGTIAGDLSSGRGFSLGNIARNVGRSVALGGIADKLKGIEGLKGKGILGGIKEAFTNQDVGKEILGAVGDVNVGDALALTVGEAAGQRADAQQAAEQGGFGGMGMANPMSTAGRVMPPGVQGTVPAQTGVAGQLTYGNQPVVYSAEGGMIPEYQIGGLMGEEMSQFLPQTTRGMRPSRPSRRRNVRRLAPPVQPQPVAPPAPPMAAGPDMMPAMPDAMPVAPPPPVAPPAPANRPMPAPNPVFDQVKQAVPQTAAGMAAQGAPATAMAPPVKAQPVQPTAMVEPIREDSPPMPPALINRAPVGGDDLMMPQPAPSPVLDQVRQAVPQTAAAMDFGMTEEGETDGRRSRRRDRGQGDESEDRSRRGEAGGEGRGLMGSEGGGERREERRSRDSGRRGEEGGELGGELGGERGGGSNLDYSYEEGDRGNRMTTEEKLMADRFGTQDEFGQEDESAKMENIRAIAKGNPADDIASVDGNLVENTSKFDPTPTSLPGIQNPDLLAQRDAELMAPKQQRTMPTGPAAPQTAGTLQDSGAGSGFFGEKKWFDPNAAQPATRDIGGFNPHELPRTAADFQAAGDEGGAGLLARLGMAEGGLIESMEPQDMQALAQAAMQLESPDSMDTIKMLMGKYQLSAQDINGLLQALSQQAAMGMQQSMQEGGLINGGTGDAMADDIFVDATMNANGDTQTIAVSAGEYIVPGDVVGHLGSGNTERGADVMDQFVEDVRIDRTGTAVQPDPINLEDVLPLSYGDKYA
jgi:hypothetical protein